MGRGDKRINPREGESVPTPHELVEWMGGFLPVKTEFQSLIIQIGNERPEVNIWQTLVNIYNDHKSAQATEDTIGKTRERLAAVLRYIEGRPGALY